MRFWYFLYIHSHSLHVYAQLPSGARVFDFDLSLRLHPYFVCRGVQWLSGRVLDLKPRVTVLCP